MHHQLWLFLNVFWTGSSSVSLAAFLRMCPNLLAFMGLGSGVENVDVDKGGNSTIR